MRYLPVSGVILLVFILGSVTLATRAEWQKQRSGSLAWLYAIQFLDSETGFAGGSNGTLLKTNNGGREWKKVRLPVTDMIRDVHFLDSLNGWMLCDRGRSRSGRNASYLMRTADGGITWSAVDLKDSPERFSRLFFGTSGKGYLIGEGGMMTVLPLDGKPETRAVLPSRFLMVDGAVLEDSRIVLAGGGGSLIFSDDSGRSWLAASFAGSRAESKLNAVYFVDREIGWTSGNGGSIFSTTDGGRSWRQQISNTRANILDIVFHDRANGFAVGDGGVIVRTRDSGANWVVEESGVKHRLERLAFAGKRAIAVGFGGTIISTDLP